MKRGLLIAAVLAIAAHFAASNAWAGRFAISVDCNAGTQTRACAAIVANYAKKGTRVTACKIRRNSDNTCTAVLTKDGSSDTPSNDSGFTTRCSDTTRLRCSTAQRTAGCTDFTRLVDGTTFFCKRTAS